MNSNINTLDEEELFKKIIERLRPPLGDRSTYPDYQGTIGLSALFTMIRLGVFLSTSKALTALSVASVATSLNSEKS